MPQFKELIFGNNNISLSDANIVQERKKSALKSGLAFDERSVKDYYKHIKELDPEISIFVSNVTLRHAQKVDKSIGKDIWGFSLGISNTDKVLIGNESGYFAHRKTDKFGFVNNNSMYEEDDKLLIIGDSFGISTAVNHKDSINYHLKENGVKSINLSVGDNGLISYLAILREYGKYVKPTQVVMLYYEENDLSGTFYYEFDTPEIAKYYYDSSYSQNLINRTDEVDTLYKKVLENIGNKKFEAKLKKQLKDKKNEDYDFESIKNTFIKFIRLESLRILVRPFIYDKCEQPYIAGSTFDKDMEKIEKIMKDIKTFTNENLGAKLKVFYLPDYSGFRKPHCHKKHFIKILDDNEIELLDFSQVITKENYKNFFPYGLPGHYNEYGYMKLAEFIINNL